MHWYCCNNAVRLLNKAKSRFQTIMNFKNLENRMDFVHQPASQPYIRPGCAIGVGLQKFNTAKLIVSHLQNYCSKDDLPTAP